MFLRSDMEVKTARRVRLCAAAILLNLLFIWGNSLMPGYISASISRFAANVLSIFVSGEGEGVASSGEGVLRKIAHVLEFCSLGILLSCLLSLLKKPYFISLPLGAAVGAIDECLQLLVPDRGPHIRDVGIGHSFQCGIRRKQGGGYQIDPGIGALGREPHRNHQFVVFLILQSAQSIGILRF